MVVGLTRACPVIFFVGVVGAMMMGGGSTEPRAKSQDIQEQPLHNMTRLHNKLQATLAMQRPQRQQCLYDEVTSNLDNALPQKTMMMMLYNEVNNN
jgi:hypothetical protein